jgi:hypothetical protein
MHIAQNNVQAHINRVHLRSSTAWLESCKDVSLFLGDVVRTTRPTTDREEDKALLFAKCSTFFARCDRAQLLLSPSTQGGGDLAIVHCKNNSRAELDFGTVVMGKDKDNLVQGDAFVFEDTVFSLSLRDLSVNGNGVYLNSNKEELSFLDFGQIVYNGSKDEDKDKAAIHCRGRLNTNGKKIRLSAQNKNQRVALFNHDANGDYSAQVFVDTIFVQNNVESGKANFVQQKQAGHLIFWARMFVAQGNSNARLFRLESDANQGNKDALRPLIGGFLSAKNSMTLVKTSGSFEVFGGSSLFVSDDGTLVEYSGSDSIVVYNHCCVTVNREDSSQYFDNSSNITWKNSSNVLEDKDYNFPPALF